MLGFFCDPNEHNFQSWAEWLTSLFQWGIGHLKESGWRMVCNLSHRLSIHLNNYWWVGISNYVYNTISVITKNYKFLLYFASVSLLIIEAKLPRLRAQEHLQLHFIIVEVTRIILFCELGALYIFDSNIVCLYEIFKFIWILIW